MDGMSLHNYCGTGERIPYATVFEEDDWFVLLCKAYLMDEYLEKNGDISDKYDPEKKNRIDC